MNENNRKKEFLETLSKIINNAAASGNIISKKEIYSCFKDILTDENMYDVVCKYLIDAGITIKGYEQTGSFIHKEVTESNQAITFYEMYLDEINAISEPSSDTVPRLLHTLTAVRPDSPDAAGELSKLYLPLVIKLCENFEHMGLTHSDLVAEGNLALYEAVLDYATLPDKSEDRKNFEKYICFRIKESLQAAVDTELGHHRVSNHLADRINALNNASTELAEDLGREATLEELCEKLSLNEEEIKQLMKITIDALSVIQTDEE
ncbi:MAG: hypothetical protein HFH64_00445 [Lachnospiraceae bacterium]|nr:hypothetical protein [Lachnospiraceae bacterium]